SGKSRCSDAFEKLQATGKAAARRTELRERKRLIVRLREKSISCKVNIACYSPWQQGVSSGFERLFDRARWSTGCFADVLVQPAPRCSSLEYSESFVRLLPKKC